MFVSTLNRFFQTIPDARRVHYSKHQMENEDVQVCSTVTSGAFASSSRNTDLASSQIDTNQGEFEIKP